MSKKIILMSVLLTAISFTSIPAGAENVTINTSGATPFLYGGHSYLPLQNTAGFLGAPLRWDAAAGQAVMTYNGQDLVLTPGNMSAMFRGQPVELSSPPVVVRGRTYVPAEAFKKYYNVPMEWDKAKSEVRMKGPSGWGTTKVNSRPPWHGGPPPWAPAWGQRDKQGASSVMQPGSQSPRRVELNQKGKAKVK